MCGEYDLLANNLQYKSYPLCSFFCGLLCKSQLPLQPRTASLPPQFRDAVVIQLLSHVQLFATPWTAGFSVLSSGVCLNSCPLSRWYHPTISSSVIPFSSCPQSFPASGSFPMSWLSAWGGQSIGASASE